MIVVPAVAVVSLWATDAVRGDYSSVGRVVEQGISVGGSKPGGQGFLYIGNGRRDTVDNAQVVGDEGESRL